MAHDRTIGLLVSGGKVRCPGAPVRVPVRFDLGSQHAAHGVRRSELCFGAAKFFKPVFLIENFGRGVGHNLQGVSALCLHKLHGIGNQFSPDAASPQSGLNKKAVQIKGLCAFRKNNGKAGYVAFNLGDANPVFQQLRQGKMNGLRMGQQILPVFFHRQTCAPLQVFQFGSLAWKGGADANGHLAPPFPIPRSASRYRRASGIGVL